MAAFVLRGSEFRLGRLSSKPSEHLLRLSPRSRQCSALETRPENNHPIGLFVLPERAKFSLMRFSHHTRTVLVRLDSTRGYSVVTPEA